MLPAEETKEEQAVEDGRPTHGRAVRARSSGGQRKPTVQVQPYRFSVYVRRSNSMVGLEENVPYRLHVAARTCSYVLPFADLMDRCRLVSTEWLLCTVL
jgi:hypothetical protein